jgi:hypothetical protein
MNRAVVIDLPLVAALLLAGDAARAAPARGELLEFALEHSTHFPGERQPYLVYVPAQYRPETPACLFVGLEAASPEVGAVMTI